MAKKLKTPGVSVEEIFQIPPSISQVETAIPAFIGYTEKAAFKTEGDLHSKPRRITSMIEYEQYFGQADNERDISVKITADSGGIPDSVEANVGRRRNYQMYYALRLFYANGGGPCYVVSVGGYNEEDEIAVDDLLGGLAAVRTVDEVTLIIFPEGQKVSEPAEYHRLQTNSLNQCHELRDRFAVMDVWLSEDDMTDDIKVFRNGIGGEGLKYGAAYYPNLETAFNLRFAPDQVAITGAFEGTLVRLEKADKVGYAQSLAAIERLPNVLPPSPAMAGVYAAVDASRGVWKAPANISLNGVIRPTVRITDQDQESLNIDVSAGKSINAIRSFVGEGVKVWGARTLAGNDNEWRYISVRRFFNMVEESVKKATERFVFEPNGPKLWSKIRSMIENFLTLQWKAGALFGTTAEEAFYVSVGLNKTMTANDVLEGRMIIEIGMAATRPAEFIILGLSLKTLNPCDDD